MTSRDGDTATCQNCKRSRPAEGLTVRTIWQDKPPQQQMIQPVVYYVRFADRVKIGTTIDLKKRLEAVPHDEVLATEPGGRDLEMQRHRQFKASRIYANREWFTLTDDLLAHIQGLR